jgi:hypothetical protein
MTINIEFLQQVEDFSLFIALFLGGLVLISSVTDKYKNKKREIKKNGKKY